MLTEFYKKSSSQKSTQNLFNKIESKIILLKLFPESYQIRESGFRIIPIDSYSIIYKVFQSEKLVKVYSIVYSASNFVEYK